ncbi:MAG: glycerol dehydrogenase [Pseudomonadota bacterium]
MASYKPYFPHGVFLPGKGENRPAPRVFVAPQRYIQGAGALDGMGKYLGLLEARQVGVLLTPRSQQQEGMRLMASLSAAGIDHVIASFGGECSLMEIERQVEHLAGSAIDCLIAVGGGKCMDAGKGIAWRLGVPVVVAPSLASNDAPCSALSVLYTPEGVTAGAEFYPENPSIVVVDTGIVAEAPERFLVAGMGDAMATWYEAQACLAKATGVNTLGTRPTLAATAIGEACARTLFANGVAAAAAVARSEVDPALEDVVEANTLLSGLGFESGGLAAAHSIAQALTFLPQVEHNYLHGEMVAIGTLTQLVMEARDAELERVMAFFVAVGLPVHLGQVAVNVADTSSLDTLAGAAMMAGYIHNVAGRVDEARVREALVRMDEQGRAYARVQGDQAYRRLQGLSAA